MRAALVMVLFLGFSCGDDDVSPDSGPTDSGVRDTGSSDASSTDASSIDVGAGDAGRDAGQADSGSDAAVDSGTDARVATCDNGPLAEPIAGCSPTPAAPTGDHAADCVARINQFRWECQCLPPLERWTEGESCATQHAEYDSTRSPHAGFQAGICSPGGRGQNECPGYPSEGSIVGTCLQQMWDEGPGEPFSEHGHYINMTNPAHSRVACGIHITASGRVWAVQNFQ